MGTLDKFPKYMENPIKVAKRQPVSDEKKDIFKYS